MRTMYDSITASHIPADAQMVAGYVDGRYRWTDEDWARFPNAVKVRIAVFGDTDDGTVLDVEEGASEPWEAPMWVRRRRAAGIDPTIYVNRHNVEAVREAFRNFGEPQPHYWIAAYDNDPTLGDGFIAKQYANSLLTGGHFDVSVVADYWPGVDPKGEVMALPQRVGQSADPQLRPGEVALLQAFFDYGNGPRNVQRKVWAQKPGRYIVSIHPPVDPDADATEHLDAEAAVFVVDVLPQ